MGKMSSTQRYAIGLALMCFSGLMAVWSGATAKDTGNPLLWIFCGVFSLMVVVILSFMSNLEAR